MVQVARPTDAPRVNAYITTSLPRGVLSKLKESFELGARSRFNPLVELVIKNEPAYHGKSHPDIRRAEDAAGRADGFFIIDDRAASDDAIWYVDVFTDDLRVGTGEADSTGILLKILIRTDCVALTWVNYYVANMDIVADLNHCGVHLPLTKYFHQERVSNCGGLNVKAAARHQPLWLTAEPGEFDESTDPDLLKTFVPRPEKAARLCDSLAREHGVIPQWTVPFAANPMTLPDGTEKTFPRGTVRLQQVWDPDFPWPEYKWPEGSL
ncbi:hypothetical protein C8034_v000672 [Colletotrichum sidae]|uniref:Uncharacterized protein n=1 Tax=Colletotrichum sidae TaxID=1347389 RepID=A0A4R8TE35_9PEZI|nr:hypothetical protein C8034_v000672 [Colletotrichum sidae]